MHAALYYPLSVTETKSFCGPFFLSCAGFFFWEKNSFYGLLSSQLPCSRCSCRRCLLPPRRKRKHTETNWSARSLIEKKRLRAAPRRRSQTRACCCLNAPHSTRTFYLINGLYPPRLNPLINSAQRRHPRIALQDNFFLFLFFFFILNEWKDQINCRSFQLLWGLASYGGCWRPFLWIIYFVFTHIWKKNKKKYSHLMEIDGNYYFLNFYLKIVYINNLLWLETVSDMT